MALVIGNRVHVFVWISARPEPRNNEVLQQPQQSSIQDEWWSRHTQRNLLHCARNAVSVFTPNGEETLTSTRGIPLNRPKMLLLYSKSMLQACFVLMHYAVGGNLYATLRGVVSLIEKSKTLTGGPWLVVTRATNTLTIRGRHLVAIDPTQIWVDRVCHKSLSRTILSRSRVVTFVRPPRRAGPLAERSSKHVNTLFSHSKYS